MRPTRHLAPSGERLPPVSLEHAARLFDLRYSSPATRPSFRIVTREALHTNSATLLHVRVGPDSARNVRERVLAGLAASFAESGA
jgi:2-succinyl-5-enolpyruvyl-6-hydroxy-3-cyclohexene-1-carboxylate synthase